MSAAQIIDFTVDFGDYPDGVKGVRLTVEVRGGEYDDQDPVGTAEKVANLILEELPTVIAAQGFVREVTREQADGSSDEPESAQSAQSRLDDLLARLRKL